MDLRITYHVHGADERAAAARAREIALEQTVELAADALPADVVARIAGGAEAVEPLGDGRWSSVIAYDPAVVSGEMPQLLNLLFGNISLQSGVVVASIEWPLELLASLGGPRHGIAGLRELTGAPGRALLCTALKPLGVSATQLPERAYRFSLTGIDLVTDDHSLSDQPPAPFRERVQRCQDAVERANRETGGDTPSLSHLPPGETPRPPR